jgi:hypothetical protein
VIRRGRIVNIVVLTPEDLELPGTDRRRRPPQRIAIARSNRLQRARDVRRLDRTTSGDRALYSERSPPFG